MELTIAFWNRWWRGNRDRQVDYLTTTSVEWDVLLLAELTGIAYRDFAHRLGASSSAYARDLVDVTDMRYPNAVGVIARHGIELRRPRLVFDGRTPGEGQPRPERCLAVDVAGADPSLTLVAWHAPYAGSASDTLRKHRAYRHMTTWLGSQRAPIVLGMDGNNWWEPGTQEEPDPSDIFHAEHQFHQRPTSHGLVDTLISAAEAGHAETEPADGCAAPTHLLKNQAHRMDRIYASPDVRVLAAGVDYAGRRLTELNSRRDLCAGSDHALVWATLEM